MATTATATATTTHERTLLLSRVSEVEVAMRMAEIVSLRSTCDRLNVGAVIANRGRIISSGYNGNVSGMRHCNHAMIDVAFPGGPGCQSAVHAEANAIVWAARNGVATGGTALFTTHQPCIDCAKLIINAGIMQVYFKEYYRLREGLDLLIASNWVEVFQVNEAYSSYQVVR